MVTVDNILTGLDIA